MQYRLRASTSAPVYYGKYRIYRSGVSFRCESRFADKHHFYEPVASSRVPSSNWHLRGNAGALLVAPTMPEWSFLFNGINYSFDLLTLTTGHTESIGGVGSMAFTGTGTVHADGFEDTPASWGLHGSGQGFNFELSGSTTAAIPEGGVLSLLGLGFALLAGKGLFGKRKSI